MAILIIGIAVVSIALGAAGAVWAQDYWRQRKAPRELKPILDWRPTLRMDARATAEAELSEDDNVPANWTLQTEEIRLVESVGTYASDVNVSSATPMLSRPMVVSVDYHRPTRKRNGKSH